MFSFEPTFQSQQCSARLGQLKSRGNALNTPCVFLDTQSALPSFLSLEQLSKANLPPHGYVLDLGDVLYLSSTDKIHSSFDQQSKANKKQKKQKKNKDKSNDNSNNKNKRNKTDESKTEEQKSTNTTKDYTSTSVLNKFYEHTVRDSSAIKSVHRFSKMEKYILLMDHRNINHREPQPGNDKYMTLCTEHGRKKITVEEYVHHIANFNTDFYLAPSEDILSNSSKSRCQKNVSRTLKLFHDAVTNHCTLSLQHTAMMAVIQGGCNMEQRSKCCAEMMDALSSNDRSLNYGYFVGGIGFGEAPKQRHEILHNVSKMLNEDDKNKDKLRMVSGLDTLDDVLLAIGNGYDVIVSAYSTRLTLHGDAMVHPISPKEEQETKANVRKDVMDEDEDIDIGTQHEQEREMKQLEKSVLYVDKINVTDIRYAADAAPILQGCTCYACTHHSRAYIRHLFNVHEMNAQILLQMHNSYRFLQFVENAKEYIKNDKFSEFCEWWTQFQAKLISNV